MVWLLNLAQRYEYEGGFGGMPPLTFDWYEWSAPRHNLLTVNIYFYFASYNLRHPLHRRLYGK